MVRPPTQQAPLVLEDPEPDRTCAGDGTRRRRDSEPFEVFYRREFPHSAGAGPRLVGSAWAEDVAQESLMVAYRRWRTIATLRSPAGYVRGICLHKATTVVRRRTLERQLLGRLTPRIESPGASLREDSARFWDEVRLLPRRQAQAIALHYALDMSVVDIAEVLGCAEGTVKVHLHRARTSLAAALRLGEEELS